MKRQPHAMRATALAAALLSAAFGAAAQTTDSQLDTATAAAKKAVKPSEMIWVIVGDRAVIEPKLKALGLDLRVVDADGKAVK